MTEEDRSYDLGAVTKINKIVLPENLLPFFYKCKVSRIHRHNSSSSSSSRSSVISNTIRNTDILLVGIYHCTGIVVVTILHRIIISSSIIIIILRDPDRLRRADDYIHRTLETGSEAVFKGGIPSHIQDVILLERREQRVIGRSTTTT